MIDKSLAEQNCSPCNQGAVRVSEATAVELLGGLNPSWRLVQTPQALERTYKVKGFAKATYLANLCSWLADKQGHHPDVSFGWGYCTVQLTTHDVDGLTMNDFIWAANLDALTD